MALSFPDVVRRIYEAGHTIGTHSQSHPLRKMPIQHAEREINDGIASVTSTLGDGIAPAPFFRFPGLLRSEAVESYLASQHLMTWSIDFPADDWMKISPAQVYARALARVEAHGKGILLLHDIHERTPPSCRAGFRAQCFSVGTGGRQRQASAKREADLKARRHDCLR
jgi:peptidoglycan/xylan/chitin deacetylase (PgdA/CDA1 family)